MDDCTLARIVQDLIGRRCEGVNWDFKLRHQVSKGDLIHDVLCLANARARWAAVPRVWGSATTTSRCVRSTSARGAGPRRKLRTYSAATPTSSSSPDSRHFSSARSRLLAGPVDVLVIEDESKKPYYLVQQIEKVRAHHVYTRVCDTNTPVTEAAQSHEIERMWRERFGLDRACASESTGVPGGAEPLVHPRCARETSYAIMIFCPEFTLRSVDGDDFTDCNQEWTRGEIRTDNNYAGWYELRYHQTLLRRIQYVGFDDRKKGMVAPDWRAIGRGRLYYYAADSVDYAVQQFWTARENQDDSRGLRIRGGRRSRPRGEVQMAQRDRHSRSGAWRTGRLPGNHARAGRQCSGSEHESHRAARIVPSHPSGSRRLAAVPGRLTTTARPSCCSVEIVGIAATLGTV